MSDINERKPLLEAKHLKKYFRITKAKTLHAVDDVSFEIYPGETLGLVGESGCGKSTVGNVVMRLLPQTDGQLLFEGQDVFKATGQDKLKYCQKMQIVFQDPYSSLNPRKTVKQILREAYEIHKNDFAGKDIDTLVEELCKSVEIPLSLLDHFPHELDGGMRQVVGIARALSLGPKFIVCDEPVSSLDVSVQAKIINMLIDLQKKNGYSYVSTGLDGFLQMSNCIVTPDEIKDLRNLQITSYVNGKLLQQDTIGHMSFSFEYAIADLSQASVLCGASIISSGTPFGNLKDRQMPFLKSGDSVKCEVEGIGSIENLIS